jgi:hypothetical protein
MLHRRIELATNVALIVGTLVVGGVLVKKNFFPSTRARPARLRPGEHLALPGVDWSRAQRTAVVVLQSSCHHCKESAPFHARLAAEAARRPALAVLAVMSQDPAGARRYLDEQLVPIERVVQARPASIGVLATPAIVLVDSRGVVIDVWVGTLSPEKERQVLEAVRS